MSENEGEYTTQKMGIGRKIDRFFYFLIKRLFDILFALIGCIFLVPITIILKIAFMCTGDFKTIFYRQKRVGKKGKIIKIFKFRSMIYNADEVLKEVLKDPKHKEEWDKNQKLENDPRVTKVGKIIRKTSLDELPQFINVLIGDMSLIGPRPLVEGELKKFGGNPDIYQKVLPGITGWWGCNGRSATDYKKRLDLEYYYCEHCNLWLDFKIVFKTIFVIFTRKGAK